MDIRKVARKYLEQMHRKTREAIPLALLRDFKALYVDRIGAPADLTLATYAGMGRPEFFL